MKKIIPSLIAILLLFIMFFSFVPSAYALPSDDIASKATQEVGKTNGAKYGSGAWCAHFVVWCAKQSGISSSVIPYTGGCTTMYNELIGKCGATVVTTPQKGDLVFYKSRTTKGNFAHVGIMIDSKVSVQGNLDNKVMKLSSVLSYKYSATVKSNASDIVYVRPRYIIPVSSIKLNYSSLTMKVGQRTTLTATIAPTNATSKDVIWSSSNTSVVYVNFMGVLYTQKKGTAIITVTSSNGIKSTCKVTVK